MTEGHDGEAVCRAVILIAVLASMGGCGYRALYTEPAEQFHVLLKRSLVTDPTASDEVIAGVREELARSGALSASEDGYPRAEIEVLRADETSEGIAAQGGRPVARGIDVSLVARAWLIRVQGGSPERDTGDLREDQEIAVDLAGGQPQGGSQVFDPRASVFHKAEAVRAAARRLGRALARRLAGDPSAGE